MRLLHWHKRVHSNRHNNLHRNNKVHNLSRLDKIQIKILVPVKVIQCNKVHNKQVLLLLVHNRLEVLHRQQQPVHHLRVPARVSLVHSKAVVLDQAN
jgi:hypothetical protein